MQRCKISGSLKYPALVNFISFRGVNWKTCWFSMCGFHRVHIRYRNESKVSNKCLDTSTCIHVHIFLCDVPFFCNNTLRDSNFVRFNFFFFFSVLILIIDSFYCCHLYELLRIRLTVEYRKLPRYRDNEKFFRNKLAWKLESASRIIFCEISCVAEPVPSCARITRERWWWTGKVTWIL